jgi:methionyl-tRNA formyltransferase
MTMSKVTFFVMTQKGLKSLVAVLDRFGSAVIDLVVIGQDKNIDHDHAEEIHAVCNEYNIAHAFRHESYTVKTAYAIAVSWRWMIDANTYQLIVLHDSLLPKYRGFAPLVNQLINKENILGVTALFAAADYDQGDIIDQRKLTVTYPYKIKDAIADISALYEELVLDLVTKISTQKKLLPTRKIMLRPPTRCGEMNRITTYPGRGQRHISNVLSMQ